MRSAFIILLLLLARLPSLNATETWWKWLKPELRELEQARVMAVQELEALGIPATGQTTAEVGYQHGRYHSRPPTPSWVQLDLGERHVIDMVSLIPAVVDWQSADRPAYAFPIRFRVDISNDSQFKTFVEAGVFTEEDFPNPGLSAVTIQVGGKRARYIRLTITKLAEENNQFFCALGEIMVLSGNLNVAVGCSIRASNSIESPPRWSVKNLVDGQIALGLPIKRELLPWDGLYAGDVRSGPDAPIPWMQLDLGHVFSLQEVRLYPVHSRFGADVPAFYFPKSLLVEASRTADFADSTVLLDSVNYPNPGNNPVTIWATNTEARFLRITSREKNVQDDMRFGLSEVRVYSNGKNVAHDATVTRTPDNFNRSRDWPVSLLVDGFTSYGRLMEWPEWLQSWERRRALQTELIKLDQREVALLDLAHRRAAWVGTGVGVVAILAASGFVLLVRHRRKRELRDLRLRLARDIHDDIGSNLAGIAVLSEVAHDSDSLAVQREDWREVNRIARDTLGAMREVLWLVGGREEAGLDLMNHLQLAASRMLAGKEVHWKSKLEHLPEELPLESRRQIFLFFKEALTNIVRHSGATRVELSLHISKRQLFLSIVDNGCGFDPKRAARGIGLNSQRMRARSLGAMMRIHCEPGKGTGIVLEVPLSKLWKRFAFRSHLSIE